MLLTEEEAKTKWCPMARYAGGQDDPGVNRWKNSLSEDEPHAVNPVPCRCIASQCAAWRWADQKPMKHYAQLWWPETDDIEALRAGEPPRPDYVPAYAAWVPVTGEGEELDGGFWQTPDDQVARIDAENLAKRRGFCGAFGKPGVE